MDAILDSFFTETCRWHRNWFKTEGFETWEGLKKSGSVSIYNFIEFLSIYYVWKAIKSEDGRGLLNWSYQVRQSFSSTVFKKKVQHPRRAPVRLNYYQETDASEGTRRQAAILDGILPTGIQAFALCIHSTCPKKLDVSWSYHFNKY